jgi:predicted GTPase
MMINRDFSAAGTSKENSEEATRRYWKKTPDGRYQRPLYIAATRQHVGKTTVSLAVLSGLQKRFDKVGT